MQVEVYERAIFNDRGEPGADRVSPVAEKLEIPKLDIGVASWLALFVFGGGLLTLYYAGIGYFPEVSWQDALTFMALMTIIGGSLFVAFSFLLFVPGAIWSEYLVFDQQLQPMLMMTARPLEPCVVSVTKKILFPFALFMSFCHFLLYEEISGASGGPLFVAVGAAASLAAVSGLLLKDLQDALEKRALPPGAVPVTRALFWRRLWIGASHAPLFAAFIGTAASKQHVPPIPPLALWTCALLPLAIFAGFLVNDLVLNAMEQSEPGKVWVADMVNDRDEAR